MHPSLAASVVVVLGRSHGGGRFLKYGAGIDAVGRENVARD